jgi:hypothetical protein
VCEAQKKEHKLTTIQKKEYKLTTIAPRPHPSRFLLQYTLDVWSDQKAVHYRISKNADGGYYFRQSKLLGPANCTADPSVATRVLTPSTPNPLTDVVYPTIPELIEHHQGAADGLCNRLEKVAPKAHAKTVVIGMDLDKKWELSRKDIVLGDMLGGGNYGEVFKATFNKQVRPDCRAWRGVFFVAHGTSPDLSPSFRLSLSRLSKRSPWRQSSL